MSAEGPTNVGGIAGKVDTLENNTTLTNSGDITINLKQEAASKLNKVKASEIGYQITELKDAGDYSCKNYKGRNIFFGIREHSMGAICNGLSIYLKGPVFCSTFFAFSNYMMPAIRMRFSIWPFLQKVPARPILTGRRGFTILP